MRKIIKIDEIVIVNYNIDLYLKKLREERDKIKNSILKLENMKTSNNILLIVNNLKSRIEELNSIIETMEYYNKYIETTMNGYDSKFNFYKNRLSSCIDEFNVGDKHE